MSATRAFYDAPDTETLNILIELGQIVKNSKPIELQVVPEDIPGQATIRDLLLQSAAQTILSIKALRAAQRRVTDPLAPQDVVADIVAIDEATA